MDYAALQTELTAGSLANECAGKSDTEIAAILNEPRFPGVRSRFISARTILAELADGAAILDKLEAAAPSIPPLKWAMRFLTGETGIDIGHSGTRANIAVLVGGGVISPNDGTALLDMAACIVSRAETAGFGQITAGDVSLALRGPH